MRKTQITKHYAQFYFKWGTVRVDDKGIHWRRFDGKKTDLNELSPGMLKDFSEPCEKFLESVYEKWHTQ